MKSLVLCALRRICLCLPCSAGLIPFALDPCEAEHRPVWLHSQLTDGVMLLNIDHLPGIHPLLTCSLRAPKTTEPNFVHTKQSLECWWFQHRFYPPSPTTHSFKPCARCQTAAPPRTRRPTLRSSTPPRRPDKPLRPEAGLLRWPCW